MTRFKMKAVNYTTDKTKIRSYDVPCKLNEKTFDMFEDKANKLVDSIITGDCDDFGFSYEYDSCEFYDTESFFSYIREQRIKELEEEE